MRLIILSLAGSALCLSFMSTSCKKSDDLVPPVNHANTLKATAVSQPVLAWVKQLGGNGIVYPAKLDLAGEGKINIAGQFTGTIDFNPGPQEFTMTRDVYKDPFTVQLDSEGGFIGAVRDADKYGVIYTGYDYYGKRIKDKNGNTYTVYYLHGKTDVDPGPGLYYLDYNGKEDLWNFYWGVGSYVQKLDKNRKLLGARLNGGIGYGYSYSSIAVDDDGYMFVTGYGPGLTGTEETNFLQKIDPAGKLVWEKRNLPLATYELTIDSKGNLYTLGNSANFYVKFDKNGNILGTGKIKDQGNLQINRINAVAIDKNDNFYLGGYCWIKRSDNRIDYQGFIQKMDAAGNVLWFYRTTDAMNSLSESGTSDVAAIKVDDNGNVYITGTFKGKENFTNGITLTSTGSGLNGYILKLKQPDWK